MPAPSPLKLCLLLFATSRTDAQPTQLDQLPSVVPSDIMSAVDANNDGKMTRGESMAAGGSAEDFSATDVDKSGDINMGELQDFLAADIMTRVDANKDGKMTLAESTAAGGTEEAFVATDVNPQSGDIDMSELKSFLASAARLAHESAASSSNGPYIFGAAVVLSAALMAHKLHSPFMHSML